MSIIKCRRNCKVSKLALKTSGKVSKLAFKTSGRVSKLALIARVIYGEYFGGWYGDQKKSPFSAEKNPISLKPHLAAT